MTNKFVIVILAGPSKNLDFVLDTTEEYEVYGTETFGRVLSALSFASGLKKHKGVELTVFFHGTGVWWYDLFKATDNKDPSTGLEVLYKSIKDNINADIYGDTLTAYAVNGYNIVTY